MNIKSVLLTAATSVGIALAGTPFAAAQGMAPHEKNYSGPGGFELTVGQMDEQFRPVPPLNGVPTNREVFLDNTFYGTIPANATGTMKAGYLVSHDYHLVVENCGGPLTIQSYVTLTADTPEVTAADAVTGDRIFL